MIAQKPKILYLDDEQENLDGFYYSFYDNYDISITTTPDEAEKLLATTNIEIVIVDQKMPKITGIDFIKKVKKQYPEHIYIIVTAFASLNDALIAVNEANIYRFLSKPWNDQYIQNVINEAIETYRMRQNNKKLLIELQNQNMELEQAYKKAQISDKLKTVFLQNLSHEVRTPLNGIMGFADVLLDLANESEDIKEFATYIFDSSVQLLHIFEDMITVSLIQAESVEKQLVYFKPISIIENLIDKYKAKSQKLKINMNTTTDNKTHQRVWNDKDKIEKILFNLIDNAIKFTLPKGNVTISSFLVEEPDKQLLIYEISDTGMGIDAKYHQDIFEPFFQIENKGQILNSGNGIGLTICKAYAELLNGSLTVNSLPGEGSTFTLQIPCIINKS